VWVPQNWVVYFMLWLWVPLSIFLITVPAKQQQKMIDLVIGVVEAKQKNQSQKTNNIGTV